MDRQVHVRLKKELPPKRTSAFINDAVHARLFPDRRSLDEAYKAASREGWRGRVGAEGKATETEDWPA